MRLGILHYPSDLGGPDPVEVAQLAEEAGIESLFVPEHTHVPVDGTGLATVQGDPLPEIYRHLLDPFVTLAAMAAGTDRLRLGTAVTVATVRDPILLAKEVASLDRVSDGRTLLGIGAGWHPEEVTNHGIAFEDRGAILDENVAAMVRAWTREVAEFSGEHVSLAPFWQWPKPIQKPHPPLLVGGNSARAMTRAVQLGGWLPSHRGGPIAPRMRQLRRLAAELDGDVPPVSFVVPWLDLPAMRAARSAGVERCIVRLPIEDSDAVAAAIGVCGDLVPEFED